MALIWDDLRYVLAVHRAGTLAGAARTLGVSHVTVFRRIESVEKSLGVRLFDRKRQGTVATAVGADIVQQAEQLEEQINALERRVWRQDQAIQGVVRITTTDTIGSTLLPGMLAKLGREHPGLKLELQISDDPMNITKRDADIAIRHTLAPPEMLIGHRVATVNYAVYGSPKLVPKRRGKTPDLHALPWVGPDDSPVEYRFIRWLRAEGHDAQVVLRCNSYYAMAVAIQAGAGVGILSCFTAAHLDGLVRLTPCLKELEWQYWILTHPELRDVARVSTVYGFLRKEFAAAAPVFAGETAD